jgi:glycosyltransferase involved in cell wall biosynthesis
MSEGRSPRVLQVVLSLNPGGTERLVVEMVKRMKSEIPMAVCCLDEEGTWADELKEHDVSVTALHRTGGFRPSLGRSVAGAAMRHRATVIHCHHYSPFVYGCVARIWSPRCRVIYTEHGRLDDTPPSMKRRFANRVLRHVPREVFAVSHDLGRYMVAQGFARARVGVIYNGIDVGPLPDRCARSAARNALRLEDDVLVVGTVARLDPVKDLGTLIRAVAALVPEMRIALLVIGDGPEKDGLQALAATLGVCPHVHFLGHRSDARALLAGCDLFANTSISEGISLTILEAMAAGLPIVATEVGGTPEILDTTCGRFVPARNAANVTDALRALAVAPAARQSLGTAARQRVEARFTLDRMVREYRDAYYRAAA